MHDGGVTVVIAQMGNAFACRSTRTAPWHRGWASGRLSVLTVAAGSIMGPVADACWKRWGHVAKSINPSTASRPG
jgi:hypothetical protein